MVVTAAQVNELRKKTGAGMMDCKKALVEANGDMQKAIEILRKKGAAVAAKRAEKSANEGLILTKVADDKKSAAIVEVNCETDFVAKNDGFVDLANQLAEIALSAKSKEEFLAASYNGITVSDKLLEQTGVIGEKIEVGAFDRIEAPFVGSYIHAGNKIATLVGAKTAGNFRTVLVVLFSNSSSCRALEKTAKNILSNPIEVSTTYGT
jgi:elongation factor Ts